MKKSYYQKYISVHFGAIHPRQKMRQDYKLMNKYFHKNYFRFLPKNKNADILDLGCGMGHFLYFLKKEGYRNYIGIDLSQECVEYCLKNKLGNKRNILFINAQKYLQKTKKKFDLIVMNDVIEHIKKEQITPVLSLIRKRTNKKGKVIIKTLNSANPITGNSSRYMDFTHTVGFTQESLAQTLRMAGFKKVKICPQNIWVFNPLVNLIGKTLQGFFNSIFRLFYLLYGRKTTTIFTKDIIAVAQ